MSDNPFAKYAKPPAGDNPFSKYAAPGTSTPAPAASPTTGQYDTTLTSAEEEGFRAWKQIYAPNDSGADYDLRGAFKANLFPDPQTGHWPDTYKKPNHPTFSDQSMYAKGADAAKAGRWEGDKFIPPAAAATPAPAAATTDEPGPARVPVNPKAEIAAPIINFLDYPIRDLAARVVGAAKGAIPRDEPTREAFYREYEKSLPFAAIPETEAGSSLSAALGAPGQVIGKLANAVSEATIGPEKTEAIAPYAGAAADVLPFVGARMGAGRGATPRPGMAPRPAAAEAHAAGYRLPPEEISDQPGFGSRMLSALSGKWKKQQAFSEHNQANTNTLAAKAIGLPPDTRLTAGAFDKARQPAIDAYQAVGREIPEVALGADPAFKTAVKTVGTRDAALERYFPETERNPSIVELREELLQNATAPTSVVIKRIAEYRQKSAANYRVREDPHAHALGYAQRQAASVLEDALERSIGYGQRNVEAFRALGDAETRLRKAHEAAYERGGTATGDVPAAVDAVDTARKDLAARIGAITPAERANAARLLTDFRGARQLFAKTYDVESATNLATGDVIARRVAALRRGMKRPLSGELAQIANASDAFPKDTQFPGAFGGLEDWSILDLMAGTGSLMAGHPLGAAIVAGRPLGRGALATQFWQNRMFNRSPAMSSAGSGGAVGSVVVPHNEDDSLARAMDY